jgi:hypothetical protein
MKEITEKEKNSMILFTTDCDGTLINENAKFIKFKNTADLSLYLLKEKNNFCDEDLNLCGFVEGSFGDCWVKLYNPSDYDFECLSEEVGELRIKKPGCHPGGNAYWIDPYSLIYVPVFAVKDVDEDDNEYWIFPRFDYNKL